MKYLYLCIFLLISCNKQVNVTKEENTYLTIIPTKISSTPISTNNDSQLANIFSQLNNYASNQISDGHLLELAWESQDSSITLITTKQGFYELKQLIRELWPEQEIEILLQIQWIELNQPLYIKNVHLTRAYELPKNITDYEHFELHYIDSNGLSTPSLNVELSGGTHSIMTWQDDCILLTWSDFNKNMAEENTQLDYYIYRYSIRYTAKTECIPIINGEIEIELSQLIKLTKYRSSLIWDSEQNMFLLDGLENQIQIRPK